MKKHRCPCCGYYAFEHEPDGTYDICPVCFWEDDPVSLSDPGYKGGANGVSLIEARENYLKYRACPDELFLYARAFEEEKK